MLDETLNTKRGREKFEDALVIRNLQRLHSKLEIDHENVRLGDFENSGRKQDVQSISAVQFKMSKKHFAFNVS